MASRGAGHGSAKPKEPRVNILTMKGDMLAHMTSGQATVASFKDHELKRQESTFKWKIEIISADSGGNPSKVLIRNDWHPQKAMDDQFHLKHEHFGPWKPEQFWNVMPVKEGCVSPVYFRHQETGKYLSVNEQSGSLEMSETQVPMSMFNLLPAVGALSASQSVFRAVFPLAGPDEPILNDSLVGGTGLEPIATAYKLYAPGSSTSEEEVESNKVVFAMFDAREMFVYEGKSPIDAPGLPLVTY